MADVTDPSDARMQPTSLSSPQVLNDTESAASLLAALVASSEDAIVSKTLDSVVTSWNFAAERLFGFPAAEMIGQSIVRIIPEELRYEEDEIIAKLRRGERIERYETVRLHKNGQRIDICLTISPVRDAKGNIVGAAKIAHDIASRKRAERDLKEKEAQLAALAQERATVLESERAARAEAEHLSNVKDQFLATLSHELRTPLSAIQGWTHILRSEKATAKDYERGLETIERNVRTQTQIVNDLLDMSRIISGKFHLDVQPLYLHEVVTSAIDTVKQSALAKDIRIQSILDSKIGLVRGDPGRLQQVLWNLLSNAIKFTSKGGRVHVVLERVNSHAEICVEDTGKGIPPEFLPRVFERFTQADAAINRQFGGLGLGLSIVKNLVELHGGTVRVKSRGENHGSTFIVSLPISHVRAENHNPVPDKHTRAATADLELPELHNVRVLIVDDDADGRILIARILEGRGAEAVCASSAEEALELLQRERFDVLLSDIGMPGTDGFQLIGRVRQLDNARPRPLPAVALTAYARPEDRQRSLLAGFHMHLSKPVEAPELIASIAGLLRLTL